MLIFGCSADHEQDWQSYPRLIHTLLYVMTIRFSIRVMDKIGHVGRDTSWTKPAMHSRFHVRDGPVTSDSTGETTFFFLCCVVRVALLIHLLICLF